MALTDEYKMQDLRYERNRRLTESDWTQASDSPLSDSKKAEWKTYRQSLRDMTKTIDVATIKQDGPHIDISSVTFPTKPS
jgi:hypothetical protein